MEEITPEQERKARKVANQLRYREKKRAEEGKQKLTEHQKELARERQRRWRLNNLEKSQNTAWYMGQDPVGYKQKTKAYAHKYNKKRIDELSDDYVARVIVARSDIDPKTIPPEMIEARRAIILLKRALKAEKET